VADLPSPLVPSLMAQAAALQAALAARLASVSVPSEESARSQPPEPERLLSPAEAAALLGVTVAWLYRHAGHLPFTRRLSRKALRFSEPGLRRWVAARKP